MAPKTDTFQYVASWARWIDFLIRQNRRTHGIRHATGIIFHLPDVSQSEIDFRMLVSLNLNSDRLRRKAFQLVHRRTHGHIVTTGKKINGRIFIVDDKHYKRDFVRDVSGDNRRQDARCYTTHFSRKLPIAFKLPGKCWKNHSKQHCYCCHTLYYSRNTHESAPLNFASSR